MRMIDADALKDALKAEGAELEDAHIFFDKKAVLDMIDEQPTVAGDSPGK